MQNKNHLFGGYLSGIDLARASIIFPHAEFASRLREETSILVDKKSYHFLLLISKALGPNHSIGCIEQARLNCSFRDPHSVMSFPLIFASSSLNRSRLVAGILITPISSPFCPTIL